MIARLAFVGFCGFVIFSYYYVLWIVGRTIGFDVQETIGFMGMIAISCIACLWTLARFNPTAHDEPLTLPEGFTPWAGGTRPLPKNTIVDVLFRDGSRLKVEAELVDWHHLDETNDLDIVAYRVLGSRAMGEVK